MKQIAFAMMCACVILSDNSILATEGQFFHNAKNNILAHFARGQTQKHRRIAHLKGASVAKVISRLQPHSSAGSFPLPLLLKKKAEGNLSF